MVVQNQPDPHSELPVGQPARISLRAVARGWTVMLAVFLTLSIVAVAYIESRPVLYASDSVVSFRPRPGQVEGRDLTALLVQTYPELVSSPKSLKGAADAAGVSSSELSAGLNTQIAPQTLNLLVSVALPDAKSARAATQFLSDVAVTAGEEDPFLEPIPVARAALSTTPVGLPRRLLDVLAMILSAAVALMVGVLMAQRRASL